MLIVTLSGNPNITIDPALSADAKLDTSPASLSLCARCVETAFSPINWAHLRGDTLSQPVPDDEEEDYHIMDDLDFVVRMTHQGTGRVRKRGPVLDFKVAAKDVLSSRDGSCTFCSRLVHLDVDGTLLSEPDATLILRLQAFWPEKANGLTESMVLGIGLHRDISGGGEESLITFPKEQGLSTGRMSGL